MKTLYERKAEHAVLAIQALHAEIVDLKGAKA